MTNQIGIYDHSTGENIVRNMTKQEQAERDAEIAINLEAETALQTEIAAKELAKSALFNRLGITAEEASSLFN